MDPAQERDEENFRHIERALLYADDAARKIGKIADELRGAGCDADLVAALEEGDAAIRDEHRQMVKRVYFRAPKDPQQNLLSSE